MILFIKNLKNYVEQQQVDNLYITEFMTINSYSRKGIGIYMKQEYKIKEVFNENAKTIQEKLQEVFISYLIEKINKQL